MTALGSVVEVRPEWGLAGFIDVETTGLSPYYDEVVELALVLFAFARETGEIMGIVDEYVGLREPSCPIPSAATAVHGLTLDNVRGCSLDCGAIERLVGRAEFLVAHNAGFDRAFVERLVPLVGKKRWLCSMRGVDWRAKGFSSRALQFLLRAHRIETAHAHRGEDDVKGTLRLLAHCPPGSRPYFAELLEALKEA